MNRRTKPSPAQTGYKWVGWQVWDWTLFEEFFYKFSMEFQSWSKWTIYTLTNTQKHTNAHTHTHRSWILTDKFLLISKLKSVYLGPIKTPAHQIRKRVTSPVHKTYPEDLEIQDGHHFAYIIITFFIGVMAMLGIVAFALFLEEIKPSLKYHLHYKLLFLLRTVILLVGPSPAMQWRHPT